MTSRTSKWYQKKKKDPDFHEEYKRKQKLYYHRRKHKSEIPDYGYANCKFCKTEFKKSRHVHYFCSRPCADKFRNKTSIIPKLKIKRTPEEIKLARKKWKDNYWERLKATDPEKYKIMLAKNRLARKKWKDNYWKKLKDTDPEKYKIMLAKARLATKQWKLNNKNPEKIKKQLIAERRWKHNKEKTDPIYRIKERLRSYLSRSIKGVIKKNSKTEKIVGTSFKDLVSHLEKQFKPGMTLSNYGKWHIDHIKPVSKYDLTKPGELEKCFHYTNLQPMWAIDNIKKSNKY